MFHSFFEVRIFPSILLSLSSSGYYSYNLYFVTLSSFLVVVNFCRGLVASWTSEVNTQVFDSAFCWKF